AGHFQARPRDVIADRPKQPNIYAACLGGQNESRDQFDCLPGEGHCQSHGALHPVLGCETLCGDAVLCGVRVVTRKLGWTRTRTARGTWGRSATAWSKTFSRSCRPW